MLLCSVLMIRSCSMKFTDIWNSYRGSANVIFCEMEIKRWKLDSNIGVHALKLKTAQTIKLWSCKSFCHCENKDWLAVKLCKEHNVQVNVNKEFKFYAISFVYPAQTKMKISLARSFRKLFKKLSQTSTSTISISLLRSTYFWYLTYCKC